ncbi:hypothetical protein DSO57_1027988 [Entomophthora muscae]|uniref:Uncharacterized protein n=1 Tax=Entomophthora muscae TaxID=34485 RepID=A0ACC2S3K9_9FUNG|nr:hypothetical protein DSO57_1027988 [Entomophthora muscae]
MPRTHYFNAGTIDFCTNVIILFVSLCESTKQYTCAYLFPPGSTPVHLITPSCAAGLEFFHPHHLNLPPGHSRGPIPTIMKEIPSTSPWPNSPPAQDFSKLGFVYITVLGLANQAMTHIRSWRPLATAVNYIVRIVPIVYMAFQAQSAFPVGVQLDSGMGCDNQVKFASVTKEVFTYCTREGRQTHLKGIAKALRIKPDQFTLLFNTLLQNI